jgi:hypothetical protein
MSEREISSFSFNQFLNEKKLMATRCKACGVLAAPPRAICHKCHEEEMEWVELEGRGKLLTYTTIAVGTPAMIEAGYDRKKHYCSGIVELDEGPCISAIILGVDANNPESIKIGTPLKVEFLAKREGETEKTLLAFRPITES